MHLQFTTIAGHFESSKRTLAAQGIITVDPAQIFFLNTFHSHSRFHDITFSSLTYVTVDHKTSYKGQFIIWKQNKEAFRWCMVCKDRTLFGWDKTIWKSGIWGSKNIKILRKSPLKFTFTFTFMHLADAFIQSDLQCIQAIHFFFVSMCSLGIEPTTFVLLAQCSNHWAIS